MAKQNPYFQKWIFQIPQSDVQTTTDDVSVTGGCFLCGKPMKKQELYVHSLSNGNLVSSDQAFDDSEDMGFYPIGSECKNRLPNNFYFKLEHV